VVAEFWEKWYKNVDKHTINLKRKDDDQIEVGSAPIKTKHGWLLIYAHIQKYFSPDKIFGIEAVLLDLKNPQKIVGRTTHRLFWCLKKHMKNMAPCLILFSLPEHISMGNCSKYITAAPTRPFPPLR
jgi:hypothetical protein